jgi:hypothetical protein
LGGLAGGGRGQRVRRASAKGRPRRGGPRPAAPARPALQLRAAGAPSWPRPRLAPNPLAPPASTPPPQYRPRRRRNAKTGKCATCEQQTQGIFNLAGEILKKMKRDKEREAKAAGGGGG